MTDWEVTCTAPSIDVGVGITCVTAEVVTMTVVVVSLVGTSELVSVSVLVIASMRIDNFIKSS